MFFFYYLFVVSHPTVIGLIGLVEISSAKGIWNCQLLYYRVALDLTIRPVHSNTIGLNDRKDFTVSFLPYSDIVYRIISEDCFTVSFMAFHDLLSPFPCHDWYRPVIMRTRTSLAKRHPRSTHSVLLPISLSSLHHHGHHWHQIIV